MNRDAIRNKIASRIEKLQLLHEFLGDPEFADIAAEMLSSNGSNSPTLARAGRPTGSKDGMDSGLTSTIQGICSSFPQAFDIRDVKRRLEEINFKITAAKPDVAIGSVLRRLKERGTLRLVTKASGRSPNVYEFLGDSAKTSAGSGHSLVKGGTSH